MTTNILIVDDHAIVRDGLKQILTGQTDIHVGGEAADGNSAMKLIRQEDWDLVLLDMSMPGVSGIELIRQIKAEKPEIPLLVLSMHKEDQYAGRALKAGASGYLCKDSATSQLVCAIQKIASGGTFISPEAAEKIALQSFARRSSAPPHTLLSEREYQIFELLVRGDSVTDIGVALNISIKTVSTHKTRIMNKMSLTSLADLVRYAVEHGLTD